MNNLGVRLKGVRIQSGLSVRELARKIEVSPSFVSQIENGKSQPSVATLYAFSQVLGVSVDELFDEERPDETAVVADASVSDQQPTRPDAVVPLPRSGGTVDSESGQEYNPASIWRMSEYANRISIVHPSHRSRIDMAAGVVWERLAATPERGVNFMQITYAPGASSTDTGEMSSHIGYEYGYVIAGVVEVTVGRETFTLRAGESLGFDSSIPHTLHNPGSQEMQGLWFVHGRCA